MRPYFKSTLLVTCMAISAFTQGADRHSIDRYRASHIDVVDRGVISIQEQLQNLKKEMQLQEMYVFEVLNRHLDDQQFAFNCNWNENTPQSNLKNRHCEPQYISEFKRTLKKGQQGKRGLTYRSVSKLMEKSNLAGICNEHLVHLREAVESNEQVRKELLRLMQLKDKYQQAHVAQFGDFSRYANPENQETTCVKATKRGPVFNTDFAILVSLSR